MLRLLRRQAQLTQMEFGIQVGYSEAHISRLEGEQRTPDPVIVATRFVPALRLEEEPETAARLVELADRASGGILQSLHYATLSADKHEQLEEVGALESVPAPPSVEVERTDAYDRLASLVNSQGAAALIGMPGIGKTTLGSRIAREQKDPVFWVTFSAAVSPTLETVIRQLALFLLLEGQEQVSFLLGSSTPAPTYDQQINIIASALAETQALLCFDDVHELKEELAWEALRCWMKVQGLHFLFISREELPGLGIPQLRLEGLNRQESEALILAIGSGLEPELAGKIHGITAGNPMLIRLALGQMLTGRLSAGQHLDELALEPAVSAYILDAILNDLHPATRQLLAWLSLFRFPLDLYQSAVGDCLREILPEPEAPARAIDEARRRQLIDRPTQAALHPLISSHIQHRLKTEPGNRRQLHLHAAEYLMSAGGGDAAEAAYHLAQAGEYEEAVDWLTDQVSDLRNRGLAADAAQVVDEMLAELPGPGSDVSLQRRLQTLLGDLLVNTTRAQEAEEAYRRALDLTPREQVGPVHWSQMALRLANCLMQRTKVQESLDLLREALTVMGEGSPLVRIQLSASMARAQLMTTQLASAEESARAALAMVKEVEAFAPHAAAEASGAAHSVLGIILRIRRDYTGSIEHWDQAIRAARRTGQLEMEYRSMVNLAGTYYEQGDLDRALDICEKARTGLIAIGDSYALARVLNTMALLHHVRAELDQALERTIEARDLKALIGDQQGWANSEAQRAIILLNLGQIEQGRQVIENVIEATRDTGEQRAQAIYLDTLGMAQSLDGDGKQAEVTLERALAISGKLEDNRLRGNLENHLVQAYLEQGKLAEAESLAFGTTPDGAGPEVELERELNRSMVLAAKGETLQAIEVADSAAKQASDEGFQLLGRLAEQLAVSASERLDGVELLRRGWVLQSGKTPKQRL
jgi:tetratricopeptide (TPR) repeat protein